MNILDAILNAQGGNTTQQLGQQFGLDQAQVGSALSALVPALAAGFQRNASSQGGLDSLLGALAGGQHQRYVDDISSLGDPRARQEGDAILGHIFGNKDVSREVASRASQQTGINPAILKAMLPVVAAMMMGALSRRSGGAPQAGFTPGAPMQAGAGGGILDMLTPMLDSNRDGSMVDDVMGMLGRYMGGR